MELIGQIYKIESTFSIMEDNLATVARISECCEFISNMFYEQSELCERIRNNSSFRILCAKYENVINLCDIALKGTIRIDDSFMRPIRSLAGVSKWAVRHYLNQRHHVIYRAGYEYDKLKAVECHHELKDLVDEF